MRNNTSARSLPKARAGGTRPKRQRIPEQVRQYVFEQLATFEEQPLEVTFHGRFCYVSHADQPLCHLAYRGETDDWDFAIYRYSRDTYDPNVLFMPTHDTVRGCVSVAMHAYSIIG
jgi:hypothetical protein